MFFFKRLSTIESTGVVIPQDLLRTHRLGTPGQLYLSLLCCFFLVSNLIGMPKAVVDSSSNNTRNFQELKEKRKNGHIG